MASDIRAVVEQAHRCRSVAQAIADPCTLRVIEKANGTAAVVTHTSAVITRAMGYFAAGKALNPLQVTLLAETLLEEYPHETMSDVVVFLRRAAMGGFDDGKTYGALDVPTAMRWWRRYLAEKAEALESTAKADDAAADQVGRSILSLPRVQEAVEAMSMKAREERRKSDAIARMERLKVQLPKMTKEELRMAWKLYPGAAERALIQAQAARSGYFTDEIKAAQEALDKAAGA